MWRAAHKRNSEKTPDLSVVGGTRRMHFVQVPEGSGRSDAILKITWQEANRIICTIQEDDKNKKVNEIV